MGPSSLTLNATITNKSTTITSATPLNLYGLAGAPISGPGIRPDNTVASITDAHTIEISQAAYLNASNVPITIGRILKDGNTSWDASIENALGLWNEQIANVQFTWTKAPPGAPTRDLDGVTSIQFDDKIYGDKFGNSTLAVTLVNNSDAQPNTLIECDVIFNSKIKYDSYSNGNGPGTLAQDIHRVALHEFGHVLNLDHPDEDDPDDNYTAPNPPPAAIMNANVSGLAHLQADDLAGAQFLYGRPAHAPSVTGNGKLANISTRMRVGTGDAVMIGGFIIQGSEPKKVLIRALGPSTGLAGALADPTVELRDKNGALLQANDDWRSSQEQEIIETTIPPGNDSESAILATLPANNSDYTAIVRGVKESTGQALVEVYDLGREGGKIANISTRGAVGAGDGVLIGGFIILGPQVQTVVVRALGSSLPLAGALADPMLELRNGNGDLLQSNDDYTFDSITSAYDLGPAAGTREAALGIPLAPGNYTAIVRGKNGTTGIALVEVYGVL